MANNAEVDQIIKQFATDVSRQTGIDPTVIIAWEHAEGTYDTGGTGGFNMLNLRPYAGDPYSGVSPGGFELFRNLQDAEAATVRRINQPFAKAILDVARQGSPTPRQEIAAIASTGWDSGHYGGPPSAGGPNLQRIYQSLFPGLIDTPMQSRNAPQESANAGGGLTDFGIPGGLPGIAGAPLGVGDIAGGAASGANSIIRHIPGVAQIEDVAGAIKWLFDPKNILRIAEVLGGFILLIIGLYMLAKQNSPGTISQVAAVATKGG